MNIDAYNLDSLRALVRKLEKENQNLKQKLNEVNIPYSSENISNIPELAAMPFQEFYDDGYSGSSMERPAIKQVLELARENKVQCIVVKDFSRFAKNYIEMGTYLEQIFM